MMAEFLMVIREPLDGEAESEPVTVVNRSGEVVFVLDDGESLTFDRSELIQALYGDLTEEAA